MAEVDTKAATEDASETKDEQLKEEAQEATDTTDKENTDMDATPDPNLNKKILRQMEYYFGNHNLLRDKFLKEKIKEDDGWISIETMLNCHRLKKMTSDPIVVKDSIKDSELIEVNEAGDKVRRNTAMPLPEETKEYKEQLAARTVYAKGFKPNSTLDDIMSFFENYGNIENVYMRRDFYKNTFKGSVFTTFKNKEEAQKFIDESDTKFNDQPLELKLFKDDYFKKKQEERKKKPVKENKEKPANDSNSTSEPKEGEIKETDEERAKRQMTQNAILHFKGLNPETTVTEMKDFFNEFGEVGYVDFEKGDTEGYLRMKEPNSAGPTLEKLKAANDGKIVVNDSELEMRIVEGDEELQYWTKMMKDVYSKFQRNRRQNFERNRRGRGGGRGRGGRGRGGGRGGKRRNTDGAGDSGPAKVQKTE